MRIQHPTRSLALSLAAITSLIVAGCGASQPSMLGVGGKSSFSDPNKSVFAPVPPRQPPVPALARSPDQAALPGQPYAPAPAAANARGTGSVTVQDGETISDIASRHRVSIMALMYENHLKDPNIFPGMVLKIPPRR